MAVVVSLINMKGGVGKTTLASQLALTAAWHGLKTLAIDLDPQANLSQSLLGQYAYREHIKNDANSTVDYVVRGYVQPTRRRRSPQAISLPQAIIKGIGIGRPFNSANLDLLPSRLELALTMKRSQIDPQMLARGLAEAANDSWGGKKNGKSEVAAQGGVRFKSVSGAIAAREGGAAARVVRLLQQENISSPTALCEGISESPRRTTATRSQSRFFTADTLQSPYRDGRRHL